MRKRNRIRNLHAVSASASPHRARKIAKPVGGKQRRAFERRNKESARQMRLMMLDAVKLRRNRFRAAVERLSQRFSYTGEFRKNLCPSARKRWHAQRVEKLCAQPRIR